MSLTCGYSSPRSDGHANSQVTGARVQVPLGHGPFGHEAMLPVLRLTRSRRADRRIFTGLQPGSLSTVGGADPPVKCRTPTRRMRILLISASSVRQASPRTEPGMHSQGGLPRGAGKVSGARSGCDRPQLHGLTFSIECSFPAGGGCVGWSRMAACPSGRGS